MKDVDDSGTLTRYGNDITYDEMVTLLIGAMSAVSLGAADSFRMFKGNIK